MKRFLIVLFLIFTVSAVVHADDLPSHVIAIKNGENATISWKNPDRMSFIRLYSIENGEKMLVSEDFDLSDAGINEYTVKSSDEAKYLLNFRSASGKDSYYSVSEFKDISKINSFINDWTICNAMPSGVDFTLDRNDKQSGRSSLWITSASENPHNAYIEQCVCDVIDKTSQYKLSFWLKTENGGGVRIKSGYNKKSEKVVLDKIPASNGEWEYAEYILQGENTGYISISPLNAEDVKIDTITLYRQNNGENCGANLIKNSIFSISDNIINNEVTELTAQKSKNSTILSWTAPEFHDSEKFRVYQNGRLLAETDSSDSTEQIFFRTAFDGEYTVTAVDNKGNESEGISTVPEALPYEGSIYRQYFDNPLSYNDLTKIDYLKNYSIQNNALLITAGKGIHLLPQSITADEFILDMDISAEMKSNASFGVLFGYNYDDTTNTSSCSKVTFDVSGNVRIGQYSSSGKNASTLISGTESTSTYPVFGTEFSHIRIVQSKGTVKILIDGKTVHTALNTAINGSFGFETNIRITPTIDNIEIRTPDASADAIYDSNYKYGTTQLVSVPINNRVNELLTDTNKISCLRLGGNTVSVLESKETLSDFVFEFDYTMTDVLDSWLSAYCGPVFGYTDEKGWCYRIGLRHSGKVFVDKRYVDDTSKTVAEWSSNGFEIGKTYNIRVVMNGGVLSLYCDGTLIGQKSGIEETNGTFGFSSNGAGAEFKNVLITPYYDYETVNTVKEYSESFALRDAMPETAVLINGEANVVSADNGLLCKSDGEAVYILDNVTDNGNSVFEAEIAFNANDETNAEFSLTVHSIEGFGYYRVGLSENGKLTLMRYDDDFTPSEAYVGCEDTGVSADVEISSQAKLRAMALNNMLYVFVDDKLYISQEIHNNEGGFGFGVNNGDVTVKALSIRDTVSGDTVMPDGYSAAIEKLTVNENTVSFDVSAGAKLDNVSIITAVYEGGVLKEIKILEPVSMLSGETAGYSAEMVNTVGNNKVKVMIFNTMKEMMPLAAVCGN